MVCRGSTQRHGPAVGSVWFALICYFAFIWMLDYNSRYCGLSTFGIPKISNAGLCVSSEHEINNRAKPEKKKVNLSNLKGF